MIPIPPRPVKKQEALWDGDGLPLNQAAAIADAVEWLQLMDAILFKKSKLAANSSERINGCIFELKKHYQL